MLWCQGQCYTNAFCETLGDDEPTWYAHVPAVKEPVRLQCPTLWMPVPGPPSEARPWRIREIYPVCLACFWIGAAWVGFVIAISYMIWKKP